ncbi:hypothetical protein EVAR_88393_1 [Eumeta japonica]|uniref:Uncharacterized protein n=1 Tax=Eumeta variegata TaxID=151549 RepID=A0A4C1YYP2_EUMVA|nr:hypothetical protein EVAR_88393_1 [Eumeta japonica]
MQFPFALVRLHTPTRKRRPRRSSTARDGLFVGAIDKQCSSCARAVCTSRAPAGNVLYGPCGIPAGGYIRFLNRQLSNSAARNNYCLLLTQIDRAELSRSTGNPPPPSCRRITENH